ncbi:patatin-like phospholipase family protein [Undibacterium jejuense]|uniref:Patatin-like phospholipase family protein n=1 Tax=Undibacterium jejuense TaxID=1344949 RepID=A0A923HH16_9BURK|nr:patatin-like phospholipase family protein [Undibacterium jejuense]MBC3861482.1 patatin-like phospholipase family protein [Undibacterium jejuense]
MLLPRLYYSYAILCLLFISPLSIAQTNTNSSVDTNLPQNRPRIALVLSGGGARGFAHIGVLRALRQMRIPVDIVVGTSMGAVVGGAYAAGRTPEELEKTVHDTDWDNVLSDRPARTDLDFRRKEEDTLIPTRIEFAATKKGVFLPPAAAGNAALENALTQLLPEGMRDHPVNQLALPFRSAASDLLTGDLVELDNTPLLATMRASLAVPGVFAPVRIKEKLVVDGGLVSNLPVEMARAMGADIIIAVNVGTPLAKEHQLQSAVDVATQMLQILTEQNVQRSIKQLKSDDILISPSLDGISFLDFAQYPRAIKAGEKAVENLKEKLQNLSISQEKFSSYEEHRLYTGSITKTPITALPVAKIEVEGTQYINPIALISQTGLEEGQVLTQEQIRKATTRLYGRGDLDNVETMISDKEGERSVLIKPTESNSSRNRLRFGMELASNFSDENSFSLDLMHVASSLNSYGGELRTLAKIGSVRKFKTQFWQPLAPASQWYIAPAIEYSARNQNVYDSGVKIANREISNTSATFLVGRQFGNWGSLEAGIERGYRKINSELSSDPEQTFDPNLRFFDTTQIINFKVDTLNSLVFPTQGSYVNAIWQRSPSKVSGEPSTAESTISALRAFEYGDWSGHIYGEWSRTQNKDPDTPLGGFLRLSGLPTNSLNGDRSVFGRIVVARKIGALPSTVGGAIRFALSAEVGGTYGTTEPFSRGILKQAGSASLSVDTRFGPLFFGAGATRGAGSAVYLFLSPIW